MTPPDSDAEYFALLCMGVEIFEGEAPESRRSRTGALSVHRDAWQDTVWVNSYEETKSRSDYTQGFLTAEIGRASCRERGKGEGSAAEANEEQACKSS